MSYFGKMLKNRQPYVNACKSTKYNSQQFFSAFSLSLFFSLFIFSHLILLFIPNVQKKP